MYGEKAKKYNEEKEKEEARKEEEKKKQAEWLASHPGQLMILFPSLANLSSQFLQYEYQANISTSVFTKQAFEPGLSFADSNPHHFAKPFPDQHRSGKADPDPRQSRYSEL
jgi:hypothetical protein